MRKTPPFTPELQERLIAVHREGDFRKATAVACGIHPETLRSWLRRGLDNPEDEPYSTFAVRFLQSETDLRRSKLNDLLNSDHKVRASVLMWYIPRRFREWNDSWVPTTWDREALDELENIGKGGMTQEQRYEVVEKLLEDPTPELKRILDRYFAAHYQGKGEK